MRRVILESPYKGNIIQRWLNRRYARACVRDSLLRGESPLASHLLYTQRGILNDQVPLERMQGIDAGLAWLPHADLMAVYIDRGVSGGMKSAIEVASLKEIRVECRTLNPNPKRVT
jgi:hypothetical protein